MIVRFKKITLQKKEKQIKLKKKNKKQNWMSPKAAFIGLSFATTLHEMRPFFWQGLV